MTKEHLEEIEKRATEATPGPWGPYSANIPFYAIMVKPSSSLSKHDNERPSYWRIEDAILVANAREDILILINEIRKFRETLEDIAELDNPYEVKYITWPASDYINKARRVLGIEK